MKQIFQNFKTGKLEVLDLPTPALKPGFVLVQNHYSLISPGTEKAVIELAQKNLIAKARSRPDQVRQLLNKIKTDGLFTSLNRVMQKIDEPLPLGYSCAGAAIAVSKEVDDINVGDIVACAGGGYASHAEIIAIPKNLCIKIPENVSPQEASFATISAIALQGIRRACLTQGEKIAVIGLGLIGQLTCQVLKAYGFPVIGFDINAHRIAETKKYGIEEADTPNNAVNLVETFTQSKGVDAVIITAAADSKEPIELAGKILRERGRVSIVGDIPIDIPRRIYYKKELDVMVSRSYGPGRYDTQYEDKGQDYPYGYVRWTLKRNMEEALRLMEKKLLNVNPLITHTFSINNAETAYELVVKNPRKEKMTAVLLSYDIYKEHSNTIAIKTTSYAPKNNVKIGLIGVGNFARATIIPALKKIKNAHLYAACASTGVRAKKIIAEHKGAYITTDWKKLVYDNDIDLIIISTRHNLHAPMVIEALKNNKNVHVEKPLCLNNAELKQIITTAKKSEGRLMIGFNRRFSPFIKQIPTLFSPNIPKIILYRVNAGYIPQDHWIHDPQEGGGRIIGEACHFIDLLYFLAHSPPIKTYSTSIQNSAVYTKDNSIITIDFKNGTRGTILYTALAPQTLPKEYIEITSQNKTLVIDNFKKSILYNQTQKKKYKALTQDKGHTEQFNSFIQAIIKGEPSPLSLTDLITSTQLSFDAVQSELEGKIVPFNNELVL